MAHWYSVQVVHTALNMMLTLKVFLGRFDMRTLEAALDNGKTGAARLLQSMGEALAERTGAIFVGVHQKQTAATPCEPNLLERLASEAEVVLTGTAD